MIRVRQQVQRIKGELLTGPVKTRAGKRDLPLLGLADEALMIRRGVQFLDCERFGPAWTDTGLVFTTKSGLPVEPRNLNRSFERICDGNAIRRVSVHTLRHTTASLLKALGVPPKDAQVILGHAHASTTNQIYTQVDEAAKRDAITKLNRLLGGSDD
jgi:integrase